MDHMTQDRRSRESIKNGPDTIWDEESSGENLLRVDQLDHDREPVSLLEELAVGQSLTVIWEEEGPIYALEEIVTCKTCGEGLTEVRLALLDPSSRRCPTCGRPPKA